MARLQLTRRRAIDSAIAVAVAVDLGCPVIDLSAILVHALFFGFLTSWLAVRKKYRALPWFALGVFLGAIATFLLFLQPTRAVVLDASEPSPR